MSRSNWQALWLVQAQKRGWLACLLWPVSLAYAGLTVLRRSLYALGIFKSHRMRVPVVVIGNVVVGGAGKTPTVMAVVNHLRDQGWRPGVVSRGHGRRSQEVVEVTSDTPTDDSGDEPALIHGSTGVPVFVAASRVAAAHALLVAHPEVNVLVCDDGLQHWALRRDVQVVVFDDRGTGNGWLLPAGLLREAWPRQGPVEDLVLLQHREDAPTPALVNAPGARHFNATRRLASHAVGPQGERMPLQTLRTHRTTAVAGIARPSVFFEMLRAAGVQPENEVGLPDHAEAADYAALLQDPARTLICTEKDAVKLFPLLARTPATGGPKVWAVPLEMTPDPAFFSVLNQRLHERLQAP
jgi:tetraacyldisaccharide 4'-kinase